MKSIFGLYKIEPFIEALIWINHNEKRIMENDDLDVFDYPDYWGMPKEITCRLSPDHVDCIQAMTFSFFRER